MDNEVARWLQESGRRREPPRSQETPALHGGMEPATAGGVPRGSLFDVLRRPALLGVLALAYLQYFFADTALKISSLHSIIFFIVQ